MKIVILVRILWSAGAQRIAIKEAKQIQDMGHSVKLIFLRKTKSWGVYKDILKKVDYEVVSESRSSIFSSVYDFITGLFMPDRRGEGRVDYDLLRKFHHIVKREKPDKVLCHDEWAGYAGYLAKIKQGVPYDVFLHERLGGLKVPILGKLAEHYRLKVLRNASKIYSVTEKIARNTNERFDLKVVPNPPGFDHQNILSFEERENLIVSVSMWDEPRNPYFFIELEKYLPDYKIILLGNWRDENFFKKFESDLPPESNISTMRGISESQKVSIIQKSRYLVRFGEKEYGLATAVIESISCGTPVIINTELGTADMIEISRSGHVVKNPDAQQVAKLIKETKPEVYKNMIDNAKVLREELTWENHVRKIIEN